MNFLVLFLVSAGALLLSMNSASIAEVAESSLTIDVTVGHLRQKTLRIDVPKPKLGRQSQVSLLLDVQVVGTRSISKSIEQRLLRHLDRLIAGRHEKNLLRTSPCSERFDIVQKDSKSPQRIKSYFLCLDGADLATRSEFLAWWSEGLSAAGVQ